MTKAKLKTLESRIKKVGKKDDENIAIQFITDNGQWTDPEGYLLAKDEVRRRRKEYDEANKIVVLLKE